MVNGLRNAAIGCSPVPYRLGRRRGRSADEIAAKLDVDCKMVMLRRSRFERAGLDGVWKVATGRGRKPTYGPAKIQAIVDATLRSKPKELRTEVAG